MSETDCERFKRENPWLWRWTMFKIRISDFIYRVFNIHLDW